MDDNERLEPELPPDYDALDTTPTMALSDSIRRYRRGELKGDCCLILHLDKDPLGGKHYHTNFNISGMTFTECIALMEVAKWTFLNTMFNSHPDNNTPEGDEWKDDTK